MEVTKIQVRLREETSIVSRKFGVTGPGEKSPSAVERRPEQPCLGTQSRTASVVADHDTQHEKK